jgi:hypothetical protein
MNCKQAREIAQDWVKHHGSLLPGYCGAYLSGSFLNAADTDAWPETSDIDVVVVIDADPPAVKPGKFLFSGVLLEVTLIEKKEYASLEHILLTHYLAYALHTDGILDDPQGWLRPLQVQVKAQYADETWVRRRCQGFIAYITDCTAQVNTAFPFHEQVTRWLFSTGITTFPILAAALQNCTVRKRYTAARAVLQTYGLMDFYPPLMKLLTGDDLHADSLPGHLRELEITFDLACRTTGPSSNYRFRSDISPIARPIALDGCRQLLNSPYPAEAVFWMAATFARCHAILHMDAPDLHALRLPALRAFLAEMGITGPEAISRRNRELLSFLPEVERIADILIQKRTARNM